MNRKRIAYVEPPSTFLREISMPFEVAISDFIDTNYDELSRKYTQARLKDRREPPSVEQLAQIEKDTESYMDDVLPQKMIGGIDLDRIGLEQFVSKRLNEIMLSGIADAVLGGGGSSATEEPGEERAASIAARVASKRYTR